MNAGPSYQGHTSFVTRSFKLAPVKPEHGMYVTSGMRENLVFERQITEYRLFWIYLLLHRTTCGRKGPTTLKLRVAEHFCFIFQLWSTEVH